MTNYLANLTDAELADRLAKIEALGKETARRLANGERGDQPVWFVAKGRWTPICNLEAGLNTQRVAWAETKKEITRRLEVA